MARLILEKEFDPPLTRELHDGESQQVEPCLEAYGVRWIRSLISSDRRRMLCEFEAPDAESIRAAFRSARVPFARVWTAELFEPGAGASGGWRERQKARQEAS
jgi:hypothetical protein